MAKLVLDNELIVASFFEDASLVGVQCTDEPHRFIWQINQQGAFDFRYHLDDDIEMVYEGRKATFKFPVFLFEEPNMEITHIIYTNHLKGEYLLPELRHTDFLWLVKGEGYPNGFLDLLAAEIRKLPAVQMVTVLQTDRIRNKRVLVF